MADNKTPAKSTPAEDKSPAKSTPAEDKSPAKSTPARGEDDKPAAKATAARRGVARADKPVRPEFEEPYTPDAAGGDPDGRKRQAKQILAAAESAGDDEAADWAQARLDAVNDELAERDRVAGERAAAAARGEQPRGSAVGRSTPPKTHT